jgi:predicted PurR-regulated permease PerM
MPRAPRSSYDARIFTLLCGGVAIAVLYVGREFLLPLALAILLGFLLGPLVDRIERLRVPRIPAVLLVVAVCFSILGLVGLVLGRQMYEIAYRLPVYQENIIAKVEAVRSDDKDEGVVERVSKTLEEVREKIEKGDQEAAARDAGPEDEIPPLEPVLVKVVEELEINDIVAQILGPLLPPLATAAMVIVFTIFVLLEREDLRNRFISLVGPHQLQVTTQAIDDASRRVSRYLRMQLIINVSYGVVIGIGLYFIGLPNAFLWGSLTAILRFIPYVGPWIAAAMPIVLSLAVFDGWTQPLLVIGLFVLNELVSNNILEPWLYGASTGLSTIGVLVSALFWTWIWGPVGLVLATPLTVCLTVLGRYIPQLAFVVTLISDEETLPYPARFYQRLLAMDPEEAVEVAEEFLEDHSQVELYDHVVLPALRLAERDRHRGDIDESKFDFMYQTLRELILELGERIEPQPPAPTGEPAGAAADREKSLTEIERISIICLPARDEADEIAGLMLADIVWERGVDLEVLAAGVLAGEVIERLDREDVCAVCVSALPPQATTHARYLSKRLATKCPELRIVMGLWEAGGSIRKSRQRVEQLDVGRIVTTIREAAEALAAIRLECINVADRPQACEEQQAAVSAE